MSNQEPPKQGRSNLQVMTFIVILSLVCAIVLSALASALKEPQEVAMELDRSENMLIAARIFTHAGTFQMLDKAGKYVPAKDAGDGVLMEVKEPESATKTQILQIYKRRLKPLLVDSKGDVTTFQKAGIDMDKYLKDFKKTGYYKQKWKLIYEILPNPAKGESESKEQKPTGYVIPVNGYGLWDAIYGYLAIKPDGETVIGISWYEQKETPGLGANISEEPWQRLFPGKKIFQPSASGKIDPKTSPIGITVVKGKVSEVLGDSPKAQNSVDGMPGATLTGNGVTEAYRDVLSAYRPFLIKIHSEEGKAPVATKEVQR